VTNSIAGIGVHVGQCRQETQSHTQIAFSPQLTSEAATNLVPRTACAAPLSGRSASAKV
jgi:hypothetical protein